MKLPVLCPRAEQRPGVLSQAEATRSAARKEEYNRLLYVALTRARDRLYVTGWGEETEKAEPSWHALVKRALEATDGLRKDHLRIGAQLEGEVLTIRGGAPTGRPAVEPTARVGPTGEPEPEWLRVEAPIEPPTVRGLAPSRSGGDEPPVRHENGAGRHFGLHAHRLLQLLPDLPRAGRPAAIQRYLERMATDLPAELHGRLAREVSAVLDHPTLAPLFGPGGRAEQAIVGSIDGIMISGQIDRMAVLPDRILLVDYKTSRSAPESVEATPVVYLRQLAAYSALLGRRFPDRPVQAALVWTESLSVVELPPELLLRHVPSAASTPAPT
jgi:ATP-dependent helicase/nuclease subunit A